MNLIRSFVLSVLAAVAVAGAPGAEALGLEGWAFYAGGYDTAAEEQPFELGLEYRWRQLEVPGLPDRFELKPVAGLAGTEDGNAWLYGGLRLDIKLGSWAVTPQFAISLYEDGDGKNLGGVVEFRSGLEIAYLFGDGPRLGVLFYHLSNADFYDFNPGSNSLVLTWSFGR